MQQADEVLDFLNEKLGGDRLSWKGDHASILFEDGHVVDFMKLDAQNIELISLVDQFQGALDAKGYQKLLAANYQGAMTGPFRLSVTPTNETLALCGRLDVTKIDTDALEDLIASFVDYVRFWNSPEAYIYLNTSEGEDQIASDDPDLIVTRV